MAGRTTDAITGRTMNASATVHAQSPKGDATATTGPLQHRGASQPKAPVNRRRLGAWALVPALIAVAGCAATHAVALPTPSPIPSVVTIPLIAQSIANPANPLDPVIHDPLITVSIGPTAQVTLLLDTGSRGLRIFAPDLPATAYTDSQTPVDAMFGTFGSASRYDYVGTLASAHIHVAGIDLGVRPFQLVTSITGASSFAEESRSKGMGIFGIAPSAPDAAGLASLMADFPGGLASGYVVSLYKNQLTVGLTAAQRSAPNLYPVPVSTASPGPAGPYWESPLFTWCYTLAIPGRLPLTNACLPKTYVDTGGLNAHLYFAGVAPPSPAPGSTATPFPVASLVPLPPGTTLSATIAGSTVTWNAPPAGTCSGYDLINVWFAPDSHGAGENSNGINPYFSSDVVYDIADAKFGLTPAAPSDLPPPFCAR